MILRMGLVAVLLVACGRQAVPSPDTPGASGPAQGSVAGQASAPATPTAASSAAAQSPPAVPDAMPIYPGAWEVTPANGWAIAGWTADAEPPDVYRFYVEELPLAGFTLENAAPGGTVAIIRFTDADGTRYQLDLTGVDPVQIALGAPHG